MGLTTSYAEQVRKTALGRDMRKPIADGLEFNGADEIKSHAENKIKEAKDQAKEDLDSFIRKGKKIKQMNRTLNSDLNELDKIKEDADSKLDVIDAKCNTRITGVRFVKIQDQKNDYYTMSFIGGDANG